MQGYYRRWGGRYAIGRLYPQGVRFAEWPVLEEARRDGNDALVVQAVRGALAADLRGAQCATIFNAVLPEPPGGIDKYH